MATLTLNKAARDQDRFAMFGKIRVSGAGSSFRMKPTDRKGPVNLPKTDRLVDVSNGKLEIDGLDIAPGNYALVADKYHWFVLSPVDGKAPRGPSVKVS